MKRVWQVAIVLVALAMLTPMVITASKSLQHRLEHHVPHRVLPHAPSIDAYRYLLGGREIARWFGNSVFIISVDTALGVIVTTAASMGFARYRFPGRRALFGAVILAALIPGQVLFIPSFLMVASYGLLNTPWGIILPATFSVAVMWFMVRFMEHIPEDLYSMGRIDGLGVVGLLRHITVPMSTPAIAAFAAQSVVGGWIDYLRPLLILRRREQYTLILGIHEVVVKEMLTRPGEDANMSIIFAGAVLIMAPAVVLFLLTQRFFVNGLFAKGGS